LHPFLPWDVSDYYGPNAVRKYAEKLKLQPSIHSNADSDATLYNLMNMYIQGSVNNPVKDSTARRASAKQAEGTWFSRTYYANKRFLQKPPRRILPLERRHPVQNGLGGLRVFTYLDPSELDEVVPNTLKSNRHSARYARSMSRLSRAK
jgi:hypothetical protein